MADLIGVVPVPVKRKRKKPTVRILMPSAGSGGSTGHHHGGGGGGSSTPSPGISDFGRTGGGRSSRGGAPSVTIPVSSGGGGGGGGTVVASSGGGSTATSGGGGGPSPADRARAQAIQSLAKAQQQIKQISQKPPLFHSEGAYRKALEHNAKFAKPGPYKTKLGLADEKKFQSWVKANNIPFDLHSKVSDYDMRGYFKRHGATSYKKGQHFPDTFKTPRDTTFSRESKYSKRNNPQVWRGQKLVNRRTGRVIFAPKQLSRELDKTKSAKSQATKLDKTHHIRHQYATGQRLLPGLNAEQTQVAAKVLRQGVKAGATRKELVSAGETGIVESNLTNIMGGEGSSSGWRQETAESYPGVNRNNVKQSAQRYFSETAAAGRGKGESAGTLAQSVQRSAFPGRYDEVKSQAKPIVAAYLHGKPTAKAPKQLPGPWAGSRTAVKRGLKGIAPARGGKRTPAENAAVGGSPTSDHLTTNKSSYAQDIPATGAQGTAIFNKVAKNLGVKATPGTYNWYTSPKAPGYRFQILWQVEGHFDHVHVGAEWQGSSAAATTGATTSVGGTVTSGATATTASGAPTTTSGSSTSSAARDNRAALLRELERNRKRAAKKIGTYRQDLTSAPPAPKTSTSSSSSSSGRITLGL